MTNNMNSVQELLEKRDAKRDEIIALSKMMQSDLDASKCLYQNKFYPQSIFYLQQSCEIGWKAYAKNLMILDKGKGISHNILNNFNPKECGDFYGAISTLFPLISEIPQLNGLFSEIGINPNGLSAAIKEHGNNIKNELNELSNHVDLTMEELTNYISIGEVLSEGTMFVLELLASPELQESDDYDTQISQDVAPLLNELLQKILFTFKIPKEMIDDIISPSKLEMNEGTHWNIKLIKIFVQNIGCFLLLIMLNVILGPQFKYVRYPDENTNPLEKYTEENVIVQHMPQLIELSERAMFILNDYLEIPSPEQEVCN